MKVILKQSCLVNYEDDRGGVHVDAGEVVEVREDRARELVRMGRALYVNRDDDPTKGANTAESRGGKKAKKEEE